MARLVDRARTRWSRWICQVVHEPPDYVLFDSGCVVLGKHSISYRPLMLRWLIAQTGPDPGLVAVDGVWETPGAAARDYLSEVFGRYQPYKRTLMQSWRRPWALPYPYSPQYAKRCEFRYGYYMDLEAMWYSICCRFGWDVAYSPGQYIGYGRPTDDFPWWRQKLARNSLVSTGFHQRLTLWTPSRGHFQVEIANPLQNIPLANLVSDLMHYLADLCVQAGAVYYYVDAAIAPNDRVRDRIARIWSDYGLRWRIKAEGPGWVAGPGAYRVGPLRSRRHADAEVDNIRRLPERERRLLDKHLGR